MVTFENKKSFTETKLSSRDRTMSTLLIPANLLYPLKEKLKEHGNLLPVYLKNLLRMCRTFTHSGMLPPPNKLKTEYQAEGLNLKRVNFRVFNNDWIELGELALAFGKSRCYIFTFLLELDLTGFWEALSKTGLSEAVPTINRLSLMVSWSLGQIRDTFARSYHVRV
ncbi:MAG: DUF1564 family protein [Leptospiraceae bacterium]|nr:DUF1564 family protein [Leptospiraceae bacterium]